ncbi:MAG: hypothetical protein LBI15_11165 [Dysgonamonadaceae bacterium]|jgi:hypothetical protein|nr:hypothetical protein [Dysgonamonadaceae bacterium]
MQRKIFYIFILLFLVASLQAQEYKWRVGLDYFFNNHEFETSSHGLKQTMSGTWLNTLGGISWDDAHTIFGGVNLLKISEMKSNIDKVDVTLFYQYETPKVFFRAGAFPRKGVLGNYSDFFFRDSIHHFIPQMQGIFFQIGRDKHFFNAWLDWTGMPTAERRESFHFGFSGRVSKQMFFADFQSYVNHLSNTTADDFYGVSEQMQLLASVGVQHETKNGFSGLVSTGVFAGVERIRKQDLIHKPVGFVVRVDAEYWGIGTKNTFYFGDPRMKFYPTEGNELYWQTPFLRNSSYVQSKWYIRLLETSFAHVRLDYNLHFAEGKMMHQQMLTVSANIDNFSKRNTNKTSFPWTKLFR